MLQSITHTPPTVFKMQNCSDGVNQDCIKAMTPMNETWKCFMAQYTEPFISSLLFGLNSMYDSWQLANILQIPCHPPSCSDQYMKAFESYRGVSGCTNAVSNSVLV